MERYVPYVEKWWFNPKTRAVEFREFYVDWALQHPVYYLTEKRFGYRSKQEEPVATGSVFDEKYKAHLVGVARLTEEIGRHYDAISQLQKLVVQHSIGARAIGRKRISVANQQQDVARELATA